MVDEATLPLALQTLATLTELLQGPCAENQNFMVSQNVGDLVSKIFVNHYYDISDDERWTMKMGAVTMLLSLMEGHMNVPVITTLMQSLEMEPLVKSMDATYREWADERGIRGTRNPIDMAVDFVKETLKGLFLGLGEGNEFEDHLNLACNIFVFMKTVLDVETLVTIEQQAAGHGHEGHEMMVDKTSRGIKELFRGSKTYRFLSQKVATIEIRRDGRLEKVYFRIPSICVYNLRKDSKEALIQGIERSGDGARIADFFERSFGLIREMEYYEEMRQTPGLSLIQKYDPIFDNFSLLIAFVINLFLLFTVDYRYMNDNDMHIPDGQLVDTYRGLGIVQIVVQCLLFVNFFFGPTRIYLEQMWTKFDEFANRAAVEDSKRSLGIEPPNIDPDPAGKLPAPARWLLSLVFLLVWPAFYKRAVFLVVAFIGFYFSPIWYCLQMLQIVFKSPLLQNVVKSITSNWKALLLTGCLLLVVVFIFSIIGYFEFSGSYGATGSLFGINGNCDSLLRCTIVHLVYGLRAGGGISDLTQPPLYGASQDNTAYARLAFDLAFFIILIVMFLNLVFGIILDTFGQLREEREFKTGDQEGKCFICGMEQSEFDRVPNGGFENHIEYDHHMWYYLFFMHYVKLKPSEDHNGQEGFVHDCMESHEPLFYPIGGAMSIEAMNRGGKAMESDDEDDEGAGANKGAAAAGAEAAGGDGITASAASGFYPAPDAEGKRGGDEGVQTELEEMQERLARMEAVLAQLAGATR